MRRILPGLALVVVLAAAGSACSRSSTAPDQQAVPSVRLQRDLMDTSAIRLSGSGAGEVVLMDSVARGPGTVGGGN